MYKIYKHTSPDGKVYIGQTSQNPKKRWKCGFGYINNDFFFRAIVKYGWDNFKHEILLDGLTKEEANKKETEYIYFFESDNPKFGYNVSTGIGSTGSGKKVICVETQIIYHTATEAEKETGIKKSCIGACCRNERITAGGFHWTFFNGNAPRPRKKNIYKHGKILCVETGEVFRNCIEASEKTGIVRSSIARVCNKQRKTAGKLHWEYIK